MKKGDEENSFGNISDEALFLGMLCRTDVTSFMIERFGFGPPIMCKKKKMKKKLMKRRQSQCFFSEYHLQFILIYV